MCRLSVTRVHVTKRLKLGSCGFYLKVATCLTFDGKIRMVSPQLGHKTRTGGFQLSSRCHESETVQDRACRHN